MNATINGGIAALPLACSESGIILFTVLIVGMSIISGYSNIMVINMADEHSKRITLQLEQSLEPHRNDSIESCTNQHNDVDISFQDPTCISLEHFDRNDGGFGDINRDSLNIRWIRTLEDLAGFDNAFGKWGFWFLSAVQLIFSFSLMCIALGVFADIAFTTDADLTKENSKSFFDTIANDNSFPYGDGRAMAVLAGAVTILPLCLLKRTLKSFQWLSHCTLLLTVAAMFTAVVTVAYHSSESVTAAVVASWLQPQPWNGRTGNIWSAVLVCVFCHSYSQKVFTIYLCMRRRTARKWTLTVRRANLLVSSIYLLFGVFGYVALDLQNVRLQNFVFFSGLVSLEYPQHMALCVARLVFAACLLLTIPVECLVVQTSLRRLLRKLWPARGHRMRRVLEWLRSASAEEGAVSETAPDSSHPLLPRPEDCFPIQASSLKGHGGREDSLSLSVTDSETNSEVTAGSLAGPLGPHWLPGMAGPALLPLPEQQVQQGSRSRAVRYVTFQPELTSAEAGLEDRQRRSSSQQRSRRPSGGGDGPRSCREACWGESQGLVLLVWLLLTATALLVRQWLYIAAVAGTFCTALLVFIFPAAIYFRLFRRGLPSDHSQSSVCPGWWPGLVPNKAFMAGMQTLGLLLLLGSVAVAVVAAVEGRRMMAHDG